MARKAGALNWATLAKMENQAIYEYFINTKKHTPSHAFWSVRKVRQNFDSSGKKYPSEIYVSPNFWKPGQQPTKATSAESNPVPESPAEEIIQAQETSNVEKEEEEMPPDNAAAALAQLIAPAMTGLVKQEIKTAVAELHANMAPVKQLVVVKDKLEINLGTSNHEAATKVLQLVNQGLNCMLVGPAGCGKTMLAETVAKALDRELTIVSCSAGMSEAQLLGRLLPLGANGSFTYVESPFMRAYANGGVILLDEMDAADANLLLVINAALANGGITVEARAALGPNSSTYVKRHERTVIIAAANTWGSGADTQYIGRGALDVSTLDRFYRLSVNYDENLEKTLGSKRVVEWVQAARTKAKHAKLRRVLSTRMIVRMEKAIAAGLTFNDAVDDELSAWTNDEKVKVR